MYTVLVEFFWKLSLWRHCKIQNLLYPDQKGSFNLGIQRSRQEDPCPDFWYLETQHWTQSVLSDHVFYDDLMYFRIAFIH